MTNKSQAFDVCLGAIPCLRHFVRVRLPADVDCTTSIEYYSVLLNHLSKNLDVSHDEKIPIIMKIEKTKLSVYFPRAGTSQFFDA